MSGKVSSTLIAVLCAFVLSVAGNTAEAKKEPKPDHRPGGAGPDFKIASFNGESGGQQHEVKYGILAPLNQKEGEKYPLVLCLHGSGGNTVAAKALSAPAMRQKYPCFILAPGLEGDAGWASCASFDKEKGRSRPVEFLPIVVAGLKELIKTEAVDPARIYVTGQSLGGIGSWAACARHSDLFAAAVPVCGAWDVTDVPKMTIPVWAFHGGDDTTVPTHYSRDLTAAIKKAGGEVKYTEYPGVGHGSWVKAYDDAQMWQWMFNQKKSFASADIGYMSF